MALDETKILIGIEMLELPANAQLYRVDELGLNVTFVAALNGVTNAVTAFRATIAALSTEQKAIVEGLIDQYTTYRLPTAGIGVLNGTVAGIQGATVDFKEAMQTYKDLLRLHTGFYNSWQTAQQRNAQIATTRCMVMM